MKCNYVKKITISAELCSGNIRATKEYLLKVIANEFGYVSAR